MQCACQNDEVANAIHYVGTKNKNTDSGYSLAKKETQEEKTTLAACFEKQQKCQGVKSLDHLSIWKVATTLATRKKRAVRWASATQEGSPDERKILALPQRR